MTVKHEPKAAMRSINSLSDPLAAQGACMATEEAKGSVARSGPATGNSEVVAHARRRRFSNADKRRILEATDRCTKPGEVGALMRREGVYSSSLSTWASARPPSWSPWRPGTPKVWPQGRSAPRRDTAHCPAKA